MRSKRDDPQAGNDLFGESLSVAEPVVPPAADKSDDRGRPLADRLRPASLDAVVGQPHLLGPDGALRRMLERGALALQLRDAGLPTTRRSLGVHA